LTKTHLEPAELLGESAWAMAFDALAEPIWLMDVDYRIVRCNRAARKLYGDKIVGKHSWDVMHGAHEWIPGSPHPSMGQGGYQESAEVLVGARWYSCTVDPLFGKNGKICGAVHVMRDITADVDKRKRLADKMENERNLLRTLIDLLPDFIFVKDTHSRFLIANQSIAKAYGTDAAKLLSRTDADFLPPHTAAHFRSTEKKVMSEASGYTLEDTIRFPDGQSRTMTTHMKAFLDVDGAVRGLVGSGHDITDRKKAEEALRESEEKFRQLFSTVSDGVFLIDVGTKKIIEVNDAALRIYGITREDLGHRSAMDFTDEAEATRQSMAEAVAGKPQRNVLRWHRKKDGTIFPVEISYGAFKLRGKTLFCGIVRDITERKRTEKMLLQANRTLAAIRDCHEIMLRAETESGLLKDICRVIVKIGGERMAWVGFAERDARKTVRPVAAAGFRKDYLKKASISWADTPRGRGPVGMAIRTRQPSICQNTQTDPNFAPWREASRKQGYGSMISLPLIADGVCFGALSIYAPAPDSFDASEQLLLTDLANDLAFGISMLRLRADRERLEDEILRSTEREQERIGRDLHDGICQLLTGAKFRSACLGKLGKSNRSSLRSEAEELEKILNQALDQTRTLARGLNPVKVSPDGLTGALENLANTVSSPAGPQCFCHVVAPVKIPDHHVANHLYRIAQEAVQNAHKHAGAKKIFITLRRRENQIALVVKDDGIGIPNHSKKSGMGLDNMRTRARLIGGQLDIRRRKGGGTVITCEVGAVAGEES
jgi:PAS domain S-box-containing protein